MNSGKKLSELIEFRGLQFGVALHLQFGLAIAFTNNGIINCNYPLQLPNSECNQELSIFFSSITIPAIA